MKITMDDSRITSIEQIRTLLKGTEKVDLSLRSASIGRRYTFIGETLKKLNYHCLSKKEKRVVLFYLKKLTGYKRAQLFRLVKRARRGKLTRKPYKRKTHPRVYQTRDIKLLEKTDRLHKRLSEKATQEILRREFAVFGHQEYENIAHVSHAHITNLRSSPVYRSHWVNHTKTRQVPIGIPQKPENLGLPGSIRVDTVHQNEVYHINAVDEITQWEVLFCVSQLSERCMIPAFGEVLRRFPFIIFNFHSDRGGEAINYQTADLLQRLHIKQTKSRPRRPNDNALVESKNASVVRKNMGWVHVNQDLVDEVNQYYRNFLNPYLNFHRPCAFLTIRVDERGKEHKRYDLYRTPYDALRSVPNAGKLLKPGIGLDTLDTIAYQYSDNEWAEMVREEEIKLFAKIGKRNRAGG